MKKIVLSLMALIAVMVLIGCDGLVNVDNSNQDNTDSHATTTTTQVTSDSNTSNGNSEVIDSNNTLEVPTFNGNSQGKLVVQCEDDVIYYIMAYDCLKQDTKPSVTVDSGDLTVDEALMHVGEVFYTKGHIERTKEVTVTGHVFSGGKMLSQTWVEVCK